MKMKENCRERIGVSKNKIKRRMERVVFLCVWLERKFKWDPTKENSNGTLVAQRGEMEMSSLLLLHEYLNVKIFIDY